MFAYYLHQLSPYIIQFREGIEVHWYGLAYVLGFYIGYLLLRKLAERGYGELKPEEVSDFITFAALFGVVLGGRVGYILLYQFDSFLQDPLSLLRIWEGGMASHGGIAGLAFYTLYYAIRHKRSWTGLGDNLVVVAPLGIMFGRIANFINGELYGRITQVSWAMKFPSEVHDPKFIPAQETDIAYQNLPYNSDQIIASFAEHPERLQEFINILNPRHPSQLYAAALEGFLLFAILFIVRIKNKNLPHGILTGLFFILYAIFRIFGEQYREPDAARIMELTRGQFYSLFMILIGAAFIVHALLRKKAV